MVVFHDQALWIDPQGSRTFDFVLGCISLWCAIPAVVTPREKNSLGALPNRRALFSQVHIPGAAANLRNSFLHFGWFVGGLTHRVPSLGLILPEEV